MGRMGKMGQVKHAVCTDEEKVASAAGEAGGTAETGGCTVELRVQGGAEKITSYGST